MTTTEKRIIEKHIETLTITEDVITVLGMVFVINQN